MEIMYRDEFQCSNCVNIYSDRQDYDRMQEARRRMFGCEKKKPAPVYLIDRPSYKFELFKCLGNHYSANFYYWYELWQSYSKGINPIGKPVCDWNSKIVDIFNMLSSIENKKKQEAEKKSSDEQKRRQKHSRNR